MNHGEKITHSFRTPCRLFPPVCVRAHNFFWTIAKHTQLSHIDKNRRLCPPKHAQHETALMASRVPTAYLGVENTNTPQNSKKTKNNTLLQKCRSHLLIAVEYLLRMYVVHETSQQRRKSQSPTDGRKGADRSIFDLSPLSPPAHSAPRPTSR